MGWLEDLPSSIERDTYPHIREVRENHRLKVVIFGIFLLEYVWYVSSQGGTRFFFEVSFLQG